MGFSWNFSMGPRKMWQTSVKDQIVNVLGFVGHMVCVAAVHLYHGRARATLRNM